ncbi:MAG: SIS domain-containing protein [Anaerolineae bacterium]|nr:SIS domain-containing protein [Thermoflexales bacterium]MDW8406622.1 SIS domain-containing protein [Anaerolineae bacterium]
MDKNNTIAGGDDKAPGSLMRREIFEQPVVLTRLLQTAGPTLDAVAARAQSCALAVLAARGSSDNASTYGKYLLESLAALPTVLAAPSLFTLYHTPPRLDHALVIGVSQSGAAADVSRVLAEARRQGALTLGITNVAGSLLAQTAEHSVLLEAGLERALAATKTVTAQCLVYAMLAARLAKPGKLLPLSALADLPAQVSALLDHEERMVQAAGRWVERSVSRVAVLGRGFAYGAAQEIALKLKETCYITAEPYSPADFQHGPLALIEPGYAVIVLLNHDETLGSTLALIDLLQRRGADVLVFATAEAAAHLPTTSAVSVLSLGAAHSRLSPFLFIAAGQLLALHWSVRCGHDPDVSRGLSKVTITL